MPRQEVLKSKIRKIIHLLHLELDGGLDFVDLGLHGLGVSQHGGELTRLKRDGKLIAK